MAGLFGGQRLKMPSSLQLALQAATAAQNGAPEPPAPARQPGLIGGSAPAPAPVGDNYKPDFWRTLDGVLGGSTITEARDYEKARHANQVQAATLNQQIRQNVTDPQELMIALANPKAWSDARAKRYEPQNLDEGHTLLNGPQGTFTAPKLVNDNGTYGTQDTTGYHQTGVASTPQLFNPGGGSVVAVDRATGKATPVFQAPQVPQGYRAGPGGSLEFIPGGPADPQIAKPLADAKRAPPRLGSGGKGRAPVVPAGFSLD